MFADDITLSVLLDGSVAREPVRLTLSGLREAMLLAFEFNADKVSAICHQVEQHGSCRLTSDSGPETYLISKILVS
jgi:hypothetical protein